MPNRAEKGKFDGQALRGSVKMKLRMERRDKASSHPKLPVEPRIDPLSESSEETADFLASGFSSSGLREKRFPLL